MDNEALFEKTIGEKPIFHGKIIDVHVDDVLLPDGSGSFREVVEHSGGVCVAALTDEGELFFVRQFRYPYREVLLELPAGKLERGEDPVAAGRRELGEECGLEAESFVSMGKVYPTVAYCSEVIHLFLARGLKRVEQHLDEGEFLAVEKIPLDEAVRLVMDGKIPDSKTQVMILKLARMKDEGKL